LSKMGAPTKPKLFTPSVTRKSQEVSTNERLALSQLKLTNFESSSSFRYDEPGTGLKSTQELSIDYTRFENHVFFNSAQSKVNVAFERIINQYPFDGTLKKIEAFEDSLIGYEKYILDTFPKSKGFLNFSGTVRGEDPSVGLAPRLGTHIVVKDTAGADFPTFSSRRDGATIVDFKKNPFSIEFLLYMPRQENDNSILFQKLKAQDKSISIALSASKNISTCDLIFSINSGSARLISSGSIEKGKFSHICCNYEMTPKFETQIYLSESLLSTSSNAWQFNSLSFQKAVFTIGSGSVFSVPGKFLKNEDGIPITDTVFTPRTTFSGSMDEVRVWHLNRTELEQKRDANKELYAQDGLVLYYKFNEPTGSYTPNDVVLDSSGNSLHSRIANYDMALRESGSLPNPVSFENIDRNPILFPDFHVLKALNRDLLSSASNYDRINPNIITKLIPPHYFEIAAYYEGFNTAEGNIDVGLSGQSIPGSAKVGSAQMLTSFLLVWAKFFDEIKIFLDHVSLSLSVDYDRNESISDKLLPFVAAYYGIELPALFKNASLDALVMGENLGQDYSTATHSLQYIQSEIWRRFLINLPQILLTKGTHQSIRSVILACGINPDSLMNIREYGGPTKKSLEGSRTSLQEVATLLDFSGSMGGKSSTYTPQGFNQTRPNFSTPFLSSSRLEIGYPPQAGEMILKSRSSSSLGKWPPPKTYRPHGISNDVSDGLLTSGSFTYEAIYRFKMLLTGSYPISQSIARLNVSSSLVPKHGAITNLTIVSGTHNTLSSSGSTLKLWVRPDYNSSIVKDKTLKLVLTGVDIFDGRLWSISFGRKRFDDVAETDSLKYLAPRVSTARSSSYFLRAATQEFGEIRKLYMTSAYYASDDRGGDAFSQISTEYNTSGAFVVIGSQSLATSAQIPKFLNNSGHEDATVTNFGGRVGQIRFWSRALEKSEWKEHVRNYKSFGVEDPLVNFNFQILPTGSFERLRLDLSADQPVTGSNSSRRITLTDFSQNNMHTAGEGFEPSVEVIKPQTFYFSMFSSKFDQAESDQKVRIRSWSDAENLGESHYSTAAPQYEVRPSEAPTDDTRLSIEFSSVKALDDDIMRMFSDMKFFDNALGNPNLIFDDFYPNLDQASKIYFNRLVGDPDYQVFFDMYKWFSSAFGMIIEQFIPRKTKFLGINFVIESHVLERNKFRYLFDDIYLKSLQRDNHRGNLLLSQIVGSMKKF
jgi:hypothetical protein